MRTDRWNKDRLGALLIVAIGIAVGVVGLGYRAGSLRQMGPGFMPVAFGVLMVVVGVAMGLAARPASATATAGQPEAAREPIVGSPWRGWLCILASVAAFVLLGAHGGLVPAAFCTVFLAALADRGNSLRGAAALAAALSAFSVLVFHYGLGVQLPLFQWG